MYIHISYDRTCLSRGKTSHHNMYLYLNSESVMHVRMYVWVCSRAPLHTYCMWSMLCTYVRTIRTCDLSWLLYVQPCQLRLQIGRKSLCQDSISVRIIRSGIRHYTRAWTPSILLWVHGLGALYPSSVCILVCVCTFIYAYVCMYICKFVCTYVCIYLSIYTDT